MPALSYLKVIMQEEHKNIDQSWKEKAEQEKEALGKENKFIPPAPDFAFFISTLLLQAEISLGQMENPVTHQKEADLTQAKFLIDTLDMLKEKTRGNLDAEEADLLENAIYELKMQYITKAEGGSK